MRRLFHIGEFCHEYVCYTQLANYKDKKISKIRSGEYYERERERISQVCGSVKQNKLFCFIKKYYRILKKNVNRGLTIRAINSSHWRNRYCITENSDR